MEKRETQHELKHKIKRNTSTPTDHLKTNYSDKSLLAAWQFWISFSNSIFINIANILWLQSPFIPLFRFIYKQPPTYPWTKKKNVRIDSGHKPFSNWVDISDLGGAFSRFSQTARYSIQNDLIYGSTIERIDVQEICIRIENLWSACFKKSQRESRCCCSRLSVLMSLVPLIRHRSNWLRCWTRAQSFVLPKPKRTFRSTNSLNLK